MNWDSLKNQVHLLMGLCWWVHYGVGRHQMGVNSKDYVDYLESIFTDYPCLCSEGKAVAGLVLLDSLMVDMVDSVVDK